MDKLIQLTDEQLKDLQRVNLEITKYFTDFCREHGLRVFVFAGACLGAVRHKGFIPWDDDIDLCMPAPDYDKLLKIWDKYADTERYSLCIPGKGYNDHRMSCSIRDNHTTFITPASVDTDTNQGLGVDFGALHAAARTKPGRMIQLALACARSLFRAGRLPNRQSKPVYIASKILLGIFRGEKVRYFIWSTCEKLASLPDKHYDKAKYVKEFSMFPFIKWLYPADWFSKPVYLPFENTELPVPKGYKEYLTKRYGDYMTPPPEKDRHPEHKILFMDLHTPYIKYRGTKYFRQAGKQSAAGKQ